MNKYYKLNPLLSVDFYKVCHRGMYEKGTTKVYSNFTPRSARLYKGSSTSVVNFGLQMFIKDFLLYEWNEGFFKRDKDEVVGEYRDFMDATLGKGVVEVDHIEALHDLGYLPLEIKSLPEGALVPMKVPVLTITNTVDEFYWLVNYVETVMSTELWRPTTNATIVHEYRAVFEEFAERTGALKDGIIFQAHDFSARGLANREDGMKAGIAHLTSFCGTDTVLAIKGAELFYCADWRKELVGTSVPATEHSVMALSGQDSEVETFRRLITESYPTGIVSIVSDTWDFWKVLSEYTVELKDDIMAREVNSLGLAKVVFRPDSGNPVDILCGTLSNVYSLDGADDLAEATDWATDFLIEQEQDDTPHGEQGSDERSEIVKFHGKYYTASITNISWNRYDKQYYFVEMWETANTTLVELEVTPAMKGAVEVLWDIFGGTINDKGFKELDSHVGLIYGDSITLARQTEILARLEAKGFASTNVVLGLGSYTLGMNSRDTFGFAMKATYGIVNGEARDIFKDPKTDDGVKKSAKGLLRVDKVDGVYKLSDQCTIAQEQGGELLPVFKNSVLLTETTLQEIRARLWK